MKNSNMYVYEDFIDPRSAPQHQINIQALSSYISSYETQQLIKLNRKLANATIFLAIATVFLAIITYLKP